MPGEATWPGFDPRYDPRFQRGWSDPEPDGGAPAGAVAPADSDPPAEPALQSDPPAVDRVPAAAATAVTAGDPPAVAAAADPIDDPPAPVGTSRGAPIESTEAEPREPRTQDPQPFLLAPSTDPDDGAERDAARILRIAFTIAWAVAGAATLVGAGLVWSLVSADDPFAVPPGDPELVLRTLAQFAAPNLLATGLLGVVVLTVVDGVRRARRLTEPPGGGDGAAT